jgi:hypothetical protein
MKLLIQLVLIISALSSFAFSEECHCNDYLATDFGVDQEIVDIYNNAEVCIIVNYVSPTTTDAFWSRDWICLLPEGESQDYCKSQMDKKNYCSRKSHCQSPGHQCKCFSYQPVDFATMGRWMEPCLLYGIDYYGFDE